MEKSFKVEAGLLRLGDGEIFHGEGILAVTKALLQSGVAYIGGYQGAPISHLLDVAVQSREYLNGLGVHVEACTGEASAAALLGASINYPVRGAVTWKSIVGTNVASDALSNVASAGVVGGTLIVLGEDYGEGASVIQERSHAIAMKSSMWLLDPRPNLPTIVRLVEKAFDLSEASSTPTMMELRIRACHLHGTFTARANREPALSRNKRIDGPPEFDYNRLAHPPATFRQEKLKAAVRLPAAQRFIVEQSLNERFGPAEGEAGIVVQGGLYNALIRALGELHVADAFGEVRIPLLVLNVVHPLVPEEITSFCARQRAVLIIEEGQPEFIEQQIAAILRRADVQTRLHGKDVLPMAGEYTAETLLRGVARFLGLHRPEPAIDAVLARLSRVDAIREQFVQKIAAPLPQRPPTFCTGCPERPIFTALKLVEREVGRTHVAGDIGCHALATFEPFSVGNSILGYGMGLASAAGVAPMLATRPIAIMGDGGFWHNGLLSGVTSSLLNGGDGILVLIKNGYTSATGTQNILSTPPESLEQGDLDAAAKSRTHADSTIEKTLLALGVRWLRTVHSYRLNEMVATLRDAFTTPFAGLKVIVAEGECQLERQRRVKPLLNALLERGKRAKRIRLGVDEDVCTGDHSCIRLSGCPSLTIRDASDPLRIDPVAYIDEGCVGCGHCGEVAHVVALCPSFYRTEIIHNATARERWIERIRAKVIDSFAKPEVTQ